MRLAFLIDGLGFGGAQRQMANLAAEMKKEGHDIHYLVYQKDSFYLNLLKAAEIDPIYLCEDNPVLRVIKIRKTIKKIAPDVLISFMGTPNFLACASSIGFHKWKVIISERITNESLFISKKHRMKKLFCGVADYIVCNSYQAQNLWKKYYPKYTSKLRTIYNIVDVNEIHSDFIPQNSIDKCAILVAARYEKVKNLEGLIEAVNALSDAEKQKVVIHWYGKKPEESAQDNYINRMQSLIDRYQLINQIHLHEAVSNIHEYMMQSDYVGLFSFMEGLPNSILEGMALGKPIIMSNVSDYQYLVTSENGFVCDPNDTNSIKECLMKAINTTKYERESLGKHSKDIFNRICSKEAIIAQWKELMR